MGTIFWKHVALFFYITTVSIVLSINKTVVTNLHAHNNIKTTMKSFKKFDHVYFVQTIENLETSSLLECGMKCSRLTNCFSFTYKRISSSQTHVCILNNEFRIWDSEWEYDENFDYFELSVSFINAVSAMMIFSTNENRLLGKCRR